MAKRKKGNGKKGKGTKKPKGRVVRRVRHGPTRVKRPSGRKPAKNRKLPRVPARNRKRPAKQKARKSRAPRPSKKKTPRLKLKRNRTGGLREFQDKVFGKTRFGSWAALLKKVGDKLAHYYPEVAAHMDPDEENEE